MALSIQVLNPLAHLVRILGALEEARRIADPGAVDHRVGLDQPRLGLDSDLESLGLYLHDSTPHKSLDSLAFLSLSHVKETRRDRSEDLNDLSLSLSTRSRIDS